MVKAFGKPRTQSTDGEENPSLSVCGVEAAVCGGATAHDLLFKYTTHKTTAQMSLSERLHVCV